MPEFPVHPPQIIMKSLIVSALLISATTAGIATAGETVLPHGEGYIATLNSSAPTSTRLTTTIDLGESDPAANTIPLAPIAVSPGTTLTLRADPTVWPDGITDVVWFKDGEVIPSDTAALVIASAAPGNTGIYRATFMADGVAAGTVPAEIIVQPGNNHPLVNLSTRATITADAPSITSGFVVPESLPGQLQAKTFLIRGIGPSLIDHGVSNPLLDPRIQVYDAAGNDVTPSWGSEYDNYSEMRAAASVRVGAFPVTLPGPDTNEIPEYIELSGFTPGVYTIILSSASGQTGVALLEIYEVGP